MSTQPSNKKNTVIIYHAFPMKPCIDGFIAAIISAQIYEKSNLSFIPYWRTEECFENIKDVIDKLGYANTTLVYVDCTPELEEEVEYLLDNLTKFEKIEVYDHHPKREDSFVDKLIGKENFEFIFDPENCAGIMMYQRLSEEKKHQLQLDDILKILQFSEYEAMDPKLSGQEFAEEVANNIFEKMFVKIPTSQEYISAIREKNMALYYVLDLILVQKEENFVYSKSVSVKKIQNEFDQISKKYLQRIKKIFNGNDTENFSKEKLSKYLELIHEIIEKLDAGWVSKSKKIGDKICNILVVPIDIFAYGRTLEPYGRQKMSEIGAQYAIYMNKPTTDNEGKLSYYFSLRRLNENFNARDLVTYCMELTGTKVGGGHPWGSGINLNGEQHETFMNDFKA